jgi:hypothetical protein
VTDLVLISESLTSCLRITNAEWINSESESLYYWRFASNQFALATSSMRHMTSNFLFQLNTFGYNYVTSSLTRGLVCRLQLLVILASAVILRSESRGTHDHILLSQIRDSTILEDQVPVFISHRNRMARWYPQALGSLFVAPCDSQGYGGGIRLRLHTGRVYNLAVTMENVGCLFVSAETFVESSLTRKCVLYWVGL